MSANEFLFPAGNYSGVAFGSFSRADMYSGAPLTFALGYLPFNSPPGSNIVFGMVPSNNNGKGANAVQPGQPNFYVSESLTAFNFEVRKFTPGANCGGGGTFGAPINVSQTSYPALGANFGAVVPQPNTTRVLDNIDDRIMQKVQYRKVAGVESLWVTHNVDTALGLTAMQWAQINVTGGTVATTPVQQQIYTPDTVLYRWMGSIAADSQGNMALGYSTSSGLSPNFPSIAYSGRLATDPPNTLPQTEVQLIAGGGSQTNNCGGGALRSLGRLHRHGRRSFGRLHVLVRQRVLRHADQRNQRQLAHPRRIVQVSDLQRAHRLPFPRWSTSRSSRVASWTRAARRWQVACKDRLRATRSTAFPASSRRDRIGASMAVPQPATAA